MTKHRSKNRKRNLVLIVIALVVIATAALYTIWSVNEIAKRAEQSKQTGFEDGPGGEPKQFEKLYGDSYKAYKSGDKQKAKDLAKQAIEYNKQLTNAQRKEVPGQIELMISLSQISKGEEPL
ncbi:MAG: hypothetical protein Q7T74_03330 [Candidatus Saccharibacteria bacterium]|nr:hypothetical protein [Candidatus Saccharibacteria bacterium]